MSSFFKHNSCTDLNRDEPKILENTALLNQGAREKLDKKDGRPQPGNAKDHQEGKNRNH